MLVECLLCDRRTLPGPGEARWTGTALGYWVPSWGNRNVLELVGDGCISCEYSRILKRANFMMCEIYLNEIQFLRKSLSTELNINTFIIKLCSANVKYRTGMTSA